MKMTQLIAVVLFGLALSSFSFAGAMGNGGNGDGNGQGMGQGVGGDFGNNVAANDANVAPANADQGQFNNAQAPNADGQNQQDQQNQQNQDQGG